MKAETKYADRFRNGVLLRHNCSWLNLHGHVMQTIGWPDYYIAHSILGQFWIEFKVWPNTIYMKKNVKQLQRIRELRGKGVPVIVATFFDNVEKAPEWFLKHKTIEDCTSKDFLFVMLEVYDFTKKAAILEFQKGKENESKIWDKMVELIKILRYIQKQ